MNIKPVVKVMNFHSLLRVEAARKKADKYLELSSGLEGMIGLILSNRNLRLDKIINLPDKNAPALRIYIGSDYGFCGSVNSYVNSVIKQEESYDKILIGKKLTKLKEYRMYLDYSELESHFDELDELFSQAIENRTWSSIELVYNQYQNMTTIEQVVKTIYPIGLPDNPMADSGDFMIEGDPKEILSNIIRYYLSLQLKIALVSSYASENIMRQNTTSESLKKIEEIESETVKRERKEKNALAFKKTIDNYSKQKVFENR